MYKNKLTSIIRYSEKSHYNKLLENHKNDIKGTWKILNSIIKKGNLTTSNYPEVFINDGKYVKSSKQDIANGFNDFFVNVGPKLAKNIAKHENVNIYNYLKDRNVNTMYLNPVDVNEVVNVVKNCKSKESTAF